MAFGDVAQLEEHHNGIVGVVSSNLIVSIFTFCLRRTFQSFGVFFALALGGPGGGAI